MSITVAEEVLTQHPGFEKGRYIPRSLADLIEFVAEQADVHPRAISGLARHRELVDTRSVIAVLAEEFLPHWSARAIDDAMLRGSGMTRWYRERHLDRLQLYRDYSDLFIHCYERAREHFARKCVE